MMPPLLLVVVCAWVTCGLLGLAINVIRLRQAGITLPSLLAYGLAILAASILGVLTLYSAVCEGETVIRWARGSRP